MASLNPLAVNAKENTKVAQALQRPDPDPMRRLDAAIAEAVPGLFESQAGNVQSKNITCSVEVVTLFGPYFDSGAIKVEVIDREGKTHTLKLKNFAANSFFFSGSLTVVVAAKYKIRVTCMGGEEKIIDPDFFANPSKEFSTKIRVATFVLAVPYVSQRMLDKDGDAKCGPSSLAMILSYHFRKFGVEINETDLVSRIVSMCFTMITDNSVPVNVPPGYKEGDWLQYKKILLGNSITFWSKDKKFSSIHAYKNGSGNSVLVNESLGSFWTWPFLLAEVAHVIVEQTLQHVHGISQQVKRFFTASSIYKKYIDLHLDFLERHSGSEIYAVEKPMSSWANFTTARKPFVELLTTGNPVMSGIVGKHYFVVTGFRLKNAEDINSEIEYFIVNDPFGNRPNGPQGSNSDLNKTRASFNQQIVALFKIDPFKNRGSLKQFDELVKAYLSPKGHGVPYTQKAFTYTAVTEVETKNEAGEVVKTKVTQTISDIVYYIQVRFKMKGY